MNDLIQLAAGGSRLGLLPGLGGGIASLEHAGLPVLRMGPAVDTPHPFDLASITLAPFSNRIGDCAFTWSGIKHRVEPNVPGEALPLHGDAHQRAWIAVTQTKTSARLRLDDAVIGPYRYSAEQCYYLDEGRLHWTLRIKNRSDATLPYGCGLHPWFPRTRETRLRFDASGVWLNNEQHLARQLVSLGSGVQWDFQNAAALPDGLINHGFADWCGAVEIDQGAEGVSARMTASDNLSTAIVFSPGAAADFFCFEPVSHPIDAHNLPGTPGLVALSMGEALEAWVTINWEAALQSL